MIMRVAAETVLCVLTAGSLLLPTHTTCVCVHKHVFIHL